MTNKPNLAPIRDGYEGYQMGIEEMAVDSLWRHKEHLYDALKEAKTRGFAFLKITYEDGVFKYRHLNDEL